MHAVAPISRRPHRLVGVNRQHGDDRQIKAEGCLLAVPLRRLPHLEPLAADRHEAKEPDKKAETSGHGRQSFGTVEACGRRTQVAQQQSRRAGKAKCGCALAGYDQGIGRLP